MAALRDSAQELAKFEAAVFMVSLDDPDKNREFAESLGVAQTLLSDESGKVAKAYGVRALGGLYSKRWTFYIDRQGVIRHIDKDVDVESAGQDIAEQLAELGFPLASERDDDRRASAGPSGRDGRDPGAPTGRAPR